MFCRAMEIGLLGSRIAYALKEPFLLVYILEVKYTSFRICYDLKPSTSYFYMYEFNSTVESVIFVIFVCGKQHFFAFLFF